MKKFYLHLLCSLFVSTLCLTSCSDDDDETVIKQENVKIEIDENSSYIESVFTENLEQICRTQDGYMHNYQLKNYKEGNRIKYSILESTVHGKFKMPIIKFIHHYNDKNIITSSSIYELDYGVSEEESTTELKYEYNKDGYIIKYTGIVDGKDSFFNSISYNEHNLISEFKMTEITNEEKNEGLAINLSYEKIGDTYHVTKLESKNNGEGSKTYTFSFNDKQQVSEENEIELSESGNKYEYNTKFTYDENGRLIEEVETHKNNEDKETYSYSDEKLDWIDYYKNQVSRIKSFDKDGFLIKRIECDFDYDTDKIDYIRVSEYTKSIKTKVLFCTGTIEDYKTDIYYTYKKDNNIVTKVYFDNNNQKLLTVVYDESSYTTKYSLEDGTEIDRATVIKDFPILATYDHI
ncbi:MAG: hypothetical protein N4A49_03855 [Marinifilaceae bacterium]|jgi:YD repeat-containing protein|nr:hypothetical protein [Marinifilaceae bacterium]